MVREKPSFTAFWKRDKSEEAQQAASERSKPLTPQEKHRIRREQVKRAQVQHRQRKANYLKQLEIDVSTLRDLVSLTEHEAQAIKKQNDSIRSILRDSGVTQLVAAVSISPHPPSHSLGPQAQGTSDTASPDAAQLQDAIERFTVDEPSPELFGDIDVEDLTVTLGLNDIMGTPCFQICSNSSVDSGGAASSVVSGPTATTASTPEPRVEMPLTPEQEFKAINFILALEHICWDHFAPSDFPTHPHASDARSRGHALTASAYFMASAPDSVFRERRALGGGPLRRSPQSPAPVFQWPAPAISLASLLGLAKSLNDSDAEITPVQAWFELATRYPVATLLEDRVLDTLLREFRGVVHCIHFGAIIERMSFESIVARVLGSPQGFAVSTA
ncbi:hypothetical protein HIM_00455 [Hirsutella minnesotensis 3608]|nr:hypothetical protein HIM_00455 [Hirsutella minnesotensis 3608]